MKFLLLALLVCTAFLRAGAQCVATGYANGTNFSSFAGSWNFPIGASFSDDFYATFSTSCISNPCPGTIPPSLVAQGFNFSIPDNASICGIEVQVEVNSLFMPSGMGSPPFPMVNGSNVTIMKGGVGASNLSSGTWPPSDTYQSFGSSTSLWNTTWTPSDINNANLGVVINLNIGFMNQPGTLMARIDHVRVAVSYSIPLPVTLVDFTGELTKEGVELKWKSSSEFNNDSYILERCGKDSIWKEITLVKGMNYSDKTSTYTFVDTNPLQGHSYYRLKQRDNNGLATILKTISINNFTDDLFDIFPNPCTNHISIHLHSMTETPEIKIFNSVGQLISNKWYVTGEEKIQVETSELPEGVYYIQIRTGEIIGRQIFQKITR